MFKFLWYKSEFFVLKSLSKVFSQNFWTSSQTRFWCFFINICINQQNRSSSKVEAGSRLEDTESEVASSRVWRLMAGL